MNSQAANLPTQSRPTAIHKRSDAAERFLIADVFMLLYLLALALAYSSDTISSQSALFWPGIVLGVLSLVTFFSAGSSHILMASVISYGHLLFVASAAVLIGIGQIELRSDLRPSVALALLSVFFFVQLLIFVVSRSVARIPSNLVAVSGNYQKVAVSLFATAFLMNTVWRGALLDTLLGPLTLVGIVMSSLVVATRPTTRDAIPHAIVLTILVLLYIFLQFEGFGRLILASYLFSIAVVVSWVRRSYLPKIATIVATVPGLVILIRDRVAYLESAQGRRITSDESASSVFGPFQSGAFILQASIDRVIKPTGGESLFTSLIFWVPRSLWPDKPVGFGRAIVSLTHPELLVSVVFSDAAPYLSEFVWDFGVGGLVLGLVVVFIISRIDRYVERVVLAADWSKSTRGTVLRFVCTASLVSMGLSYVWGGAFTFITRIATGIVILIMLFWLFGRITRRRSGRASFARRG